MLGYKRRIGRQFRDPRSFGLIWITKASRRVEPVLRRAFEKNRGYREEVFEFRVAYYLRTVEGAV
jgi:hypothetical protein